uniref:carnosine N-methyltransferase-like n=1 Tax=Erigeron canadensis TaxID=72917 RepID=UPI001CB8B37D|nr:carnosine N-methyltransferase-like [Erigeron canadensis]
MSSNNNDKKENIIIMSSEVTEVNKEEEEEEEIRRRKAEEEAMEVKSLRRIISAYLNYPEAAEEDVRRYERSFRKLPLSHKALLAHLPLKYQKMRWCISENTHFIFEMLNAFEPPVDMSQDDENCEHLNNGSCGYHHSEDGDPCCGSASISGRAHFAKSVEACCGHEEKNGTCCEPESKNFPVDLECKTDTHKGGCDSGRDAQDQGLSNTANDSHKNISSDMLEPMPHFHVPLVDVDKVRCVIRNIVRDWAAEGQKERDQCYTPILEELKRLFPDRSVESPPTCLVPGAGLGRLALEISCLGFASQGNEFSYYMMICSSFILNQTQAVEEWTIYPWIHSNCNSLTDADQLRSVSVPDIHPAGAGITEGFSMCGGDFVEVYSEPCQVAAWDAVVTCFFLDTAHNIVEYIQIISRILKDGGVWINLGPLLYHFADMYGQDDEMSIELSLEDVKRIAIHYGFQLEVEKTIETTYTTNPRAMMQNRYFSAFWTMRKKPSATTSIQQDMDE